MGFLDRLRHDGLGWFELQIGSLELRVGTKAGAAGGLRDEARIVAMHHWEQLEAYVASNSAFQTSFVPLPVGNGAPPVVRAMGEAADAAGVGPMVTLPGAIAEAVARDLSTHAREVIVTTEGDTYAVNGRAQTFVVDPGAGPERPGMGVRVPGGQPYAFYTSAGYTSPGYTSAGRSRLNPSIGHARVVAVLAEHGAVADAAASAIGLAMMHPTHVERALLATRRLEGQGLKGVLIVAGSTIGVWGSIEIVPAPRPASGVSRK